PVADVVGALRQTDRARDDVREHRTRRQEGSGRPRAWVARADQSRGGSNAPDDQRHVQPSLVGRALEGPGRVEAMDQRDPREADCLASMERRILLIANETVEARALEKVSRGRSVEVLVIAPALNSRLRHWISDEDDARRTAGLRLGRCLQLLGARGIAANGSV